jgi:hypothetical protein
MDSPKLPDSLPNEEKLKILTEHVSFLSKEKDSMENKLNKINKDLVKFNKDIDKLREKITKELLKSTEKEKAKLEKEREKMNRETEKQKNKIEKELTKTIKEKEAELQAKEEELIQHKETIKNIAIASTKTMLPNSCIYLFKLGLTEELKDIFKIPEEFVDKNTCIYKFGMTNDIDRREKEHKSLYTKVGCSCIERIIQQQSSIIVNKENENKLFEYFSDKKFAFISEGYKAKQKFNELVCIRDKDLKLVRKYYEKSLI